MKRKTVLRNRHPYKPVFIIYRLRPTIEKNGSNKDATNKLKVMQKAVERSISRHWIGQVVPQDQSKWTI